MIWNITATETTEPVTLADAKLWIHHALASSDTSEDDMINAMISAARQLAEEKCKRAFVNHTYEMILDAFPDDSTAAIKLPRPPLSTTAADLTVTYYNTTDGLTTTIPASAMTVDYKSEPGRVYPSNDNEWPTDAIERSDAITISYKAGNNSVCPGPVKNWIMMKVGSMYAQRESFIVGVSKTDMGRDFVDGLLDPFRILENSI
jgi:uncharacterized phiE125 gp8 family phage protein